MADQSVELTGKIVLREVIESDLPIFFEHQRDPVASHMAAFTSKEPSDRTAFDVHWKKILEDSNNGIRTILVGDRVAGYVASWVDPSWRGKPEVTYWLGKEYWSRGIATKALQAFLTETTTRPMYARAARDNLASLRVLKKCGFKIFGYGKGFAPARNAEIEEAMLELK